jgi:hypothetical protein
MSQDKEKVGLFELAAIEMTRVDAGGDAGEQLSIAEARQGLSCALKVMADYLTMGQVADLIIASAMKNKMPRRMAD